MKGCPTFIGSRGVLVERIPGKVRITRDSAVIQHNDPNAATDDNYSRGFKMVQQKALFLESY